MVWLVQKTTIAAGSSVASIAPVLNGVTAGNTLVLLVSHFGATDILPVDSSAQVWSKAAFIANEFAVYYLLNANSGAHTVTWACGAGTFPTYQLVEGLPLSSFDLVGTSAAGSPGTVTATSITTTGTTDIVFGMMVVDGSLGNAALGITDPPTSYTSIGVWNDSTSFEGAEFCYRQLATGATGGVTWTMSNTDSGQAIRAVLLSFVLTPSGSAPIDEDGEYIQTVQMW